MISSTSLRSPQKISGLFDTGFAGDAFGITSWDMNASVESIDNPFTLDSLDSANFSISDPLALSQGDAFAGGKLDHVQPNLMDSFDMLNPLADLETDQLADDSLDAFVDLDKFLMQDSFFDETVEVKPVINISEVDMTPSTISSDLEFVAADGDIFLEAATSSTPSRKRKLGTAAPVSTSIKTSLFEIPVAENTVSTVSTAGAQLDHDYTHKRQKMSAASGSGQKSKANGNSTSKGKPALPILQIDSNTSSSAVDSCNEVVNGDRQAVRRLKNNVASKRSREQRKKKFADLDSEAENLVVVNESLRQKIVELEKLAKEMKAQLVAKMAGKG